MPDAEIPSPPVAVLPALERVLRASSEILERMPTATCICDLAGRIVQYNSRAAELWGRRPQPGQRHAEFAAQTQYFNQEGGRLPRSKIDEVLKTGQPLRDVEVKILRPDRDLYVVLLNVEPLFDENGQMFGVINCIQDITERKQAAEALSRSQQDLRQQEQRWRATYEHAAIGIVETDAEGRFLRMNEAVCNFIGLSREALMATRLFERDHADDSESDAAEYDRQVRGEIDFYSTEKRVMRGDGRMIWCSIRSSTVRAADGHFLYAVRVMQDITERKEAERLQKLLIDELNHRVKNTLATVQSLAVQTALGATTLAAFQPAFEGRLIALGQVHDQLMRRRWTSADLGDIVGAATAPYLAQGRDRLTITGDNVILSPRAAQTLALTFHELTTNAVKYGALSEPGGRIEVTWQLIRDAARPMLRLEWRERGGPPVIAPQQRGFGSRFIESAVAAELKGRVTLTFDAAGLGCAMEIPLDPKLFKLGDDDKPAS